MVHEMTFRIWPLLCSAHYRKGKLRNGSALCKVVLCVMSLVGKGQVFNMKVAVDEFKCLYSSLLC